MDDVDKKTLADIGKKIVWTDINQKRPSSRQSKNSLDWCQPKDIINRCRLKILANIGQKIALTEFGRKTLPIILQN